MTVAPRSYRAAPGTYGLSAGLAVEAALMTLSVIVAWALSATFVDPAWSLVAMANYTWMAVLMFRIEPRATVLMLGGLISQASTMVSLIFIEYGASIPELGVVGMPGPYASSFLFYALVSFAASIATFRLLVGREGHMRGGPMSAVFDRYANGIALAFVGIIGLLIAWMILRGLMTGFPLLAGIDRFQYRRLIGDKVTVYALNLKFILMFAIGMVVFRLPAIRPLKMVAIGQAIALVIVFFLFADKFFTQLGGLVGLFAPYLYIHHQKVRKRLAAYGVIALAALALVFTVTWYIYSNGYTMTRAATMERLSGRIVGQGELWFLQARIGAPLLTKDDEFISRNIDALRVKEADLYAVQQSLGPNYFSNRYAPDKLRNSLRRNAGSVTYTGALEPLALANFGWAGMVLVMIVTGGLLALAMGYLAYAIVSRSIVSVMFAAYLLVQLRKSLDQFTPWVLFSIFSLKWVAVIAVIEFGIYVLGVTQRKKVRFPDGTRRPQFVDRRAAGASKPVVSPERA